MEYSKELIDAVGVVVAALGAAPGGGVLIPAELVAAALERPKGPKPGDLMGLWNSHANDLLPRCRAMTAARRARCTARLREFPEKEDWAGFIAAINCNPWALGTEPNPSFPNWRADFDWFIRPGSILRFVEGRFSQAPGKPKTSREEYSDKIDRR